VIGKGKHPRRFRALPIGGKPVYLELDVPRVECRQCGAVRQVRIGFADPRVSYTRAFERYALELSKSMTIKDVAHHLGISWDVIKEIQKRHLKRERSNRGILHGVISWVEDYPSPRRLRGGRCPIEARRSWRTGGACWNVSRRVV
jgi:transposase